MINKSNYRFGNLSLIFSEQYQMATITKHCFASFLAVIVDGLTWSTCYFFFLKYSLGCFETTNLRFKAVYNYSIILLVKDLWTQMELARFQQNNALSTMCALDGNKWDFLQTKAGKAHCLTCQGGGINDELWVKSVSVAERIGQDESPLGISVIHLQRGRSKD